MKDVEKLLKMYSFRWTSASRRPFMAVVHMITGVAGLETVAIRVM